jgi:hypothetical protein
VTTTRRRRWRTTPRSTPSPPDAAALPALRLRRPRALKTDEDKKYLDDIRSGRGNVSGFVRVGLFKRLSSSGHSFILSLQRQRARNELFIHAIDHKLQIPLGSSPTGRSPSATRTSRARSHWAGRVASRYQELRRVAPAKTKWLNSTVFKTTLRHDLVKDNELITVLLERFGTGTPPGTAR